MPHQLTCCKWCCQFYPGKIPNDVCLACLEHSCTFPVATTEIYNVLHENIISASSVNSFRHQLFQFWQSLLLIAI